MMFMKETALKQNKANESKPPTSSVRHVTWVTCDKIIDLNEADSLSQRTCVSHNGWENSDEILNINVAGEVFQTFSKTLDRYPDTLLGNYIQREKYLNKQTGELFFNRHSEAFESILYYYQSEGEMYTPLNISLENFIEELVFFGIGKSVIEQLEIDNGTKEPPVTIKLPHFYPFKILWQFLEYPHSSRSAKVFALLSVVVIVVSITIFVIETLPEFSTVTMETNSTIISATTSSRHNITGESVTTPSRHALWMHIVNTAAVIWFTVEYILRLISSPNKLEFLVTAGNIIDLLSILPYYVASFLSSSSSRVLSVIRVVRVLRVLKLSRYSRGLQILGKTLEASYQELSMLAFFLLVMLLIFASTVYYAEYQVEGTKYISIPHAGWWAIVTLTTVGYGDISPSSVIGKLISCITLLSGVILLSLPIPTVVSHFSHFYRIETNRKQAEQTK